MTPFETKTDFCVTGICDKTVICKSDGRFVVFTNEISLNLTVRDALVFFKWLEAPLATSII